MDPLRRQVNLAISIWVYMGLVLNVETVKKEKPVSNDTTVLLELGFAKKTLALKDIHIIILQISQT